MPKTHLAYLVDLQGQGLKARQIFRHDEPIYRRSHLIYAALVAKPTNLSSSSYPPIVHHIPYHADFSHEARSKQRIFLKEVERPTKTWYLLNTTNQYFVLNTVTWNP